MRSDKEEPENGGFFAILRRSSNPWVVLLRDLLWVAGVVGGIALALFLICGTWPALVAVESESMVPHMNVGDLIIVVQKDRFGLLQTQEEGLASGRQTFGDYGDVIVYRPNGAGTTHPIIHRAIRFVHTGDQYTRPVAGSATVLTAPHDGYVTLGDNNRGIIDQGGYLPGVGIIEPVQEEWIVGKAALSIPFLGYPSLHILEFGAALIAILLVYELLTSARKGKDEKPQKKKR
jgi:signal peptidase